MNQCHTKSVDDTVGIVLLLPSLVHLCGYASDKSWWIYSPFVPVLFFCLWTGEIELKIQVANIPLSLVIKLLRPCTNMATLFFLLHMHILTYSVFRCNHCSSITRFPRYNDPHKVWVTHPMIQLVFTFEYIPPKWKWMIKLYVFLALEASAN